jgi:hypothetical protein
VGPRAQKDRERFPPNNILFTLTGAGLLWMGWAGFNGGGPYAANSVASMSVLNTNICTAMSLIVWTCLDVIFFGKPSVIGAVQGMITGLVCITPGAGNRRLPCPARRLAKLAGRRRTSCPLGHGGAAHRPILEFLGRCSCSDRWGDEHACTQHAQRKKLPLVALEVQ